jgi:hypothetical protein
MNGDQFSTEGVGTFWLLTIFWSIGMFAAIWGLGLWNSGQASASDVSWTLVVLFLPGCVFCYTPVWIGRHVQERREDRRRGFLAEDLLGEVGCRVAPNDYINTQQIRTLLRAGYDATRPPPGDPTETRQANPFSDR